LTAIKAPVSGTIVGLKVNTKGATIAVNQIVGEILPSESALIVDAQVSPNVIDRVKVGISADMRFTTFNANTTPVIAGTVILVGADKLPAVEGEKGGEFYLAKVQATKEGLAELGRNEIQPGMPVDVVFKTGERTFFSYLLKPITDRFALSFKQ